MCGTVAMDGVVFASDLCISSPDDSNVRSTALQAIQDVS